mmetsp:Transcript_9818/g.21187  ORF Transcript_9818/g.21187 Transcript_9818/m.21187 type:complete len:768 (+) Transcript_9818:80-2383(+)
MSSAGYDPRDELQHDRRLIMKKIQAHRRQNLSKNGNASSGGLRNSDTSGMISVSDHPSPRDSFDEDDEDQDNVFEAVKAAHEQDEELIGGRDGQEALEAALSSPPTGWWAMRKQWQKRRGSFVFGGKSNDEDVDVQSIADNITSRRLGQAPKPITTDAGVVAHPVMLADPQSMGYDAAAFRGNSDANAALDPKAQKMAKKRLMNRAPPIVYVSHGTLRKRKMQQIAYIAASLCVVFLFMFFLEQRKLSHYSMVESPMSLSAYLAGESMLAEEEKEKITFSDLGDRDPQMQSNEVFFGEDRVEVSPEEMSHLGNVLNVGLKEQRDADIEHFVGSSLVHGSARLHLLRDMIVANGITPVNVFENHASPQYKALDWMAFHDTLEVVPEDTASTQKAIQRYALAVVYYATGGLNWNEQINFLSGTDECSWNDRVNGYFLGAGRCNGYGMITTLALWGNNLMGFLPNEIGAFVHLEELSFYDNMVRGPTPKTLHNIKSLKVLYLHKNQLQGDLNFMCDYNVKYVKADCGSSGGVTCSCCMECGFQVIPSVQDSLELEAEEGSGDAKNVNRFRRLKEIFVRYDVTPKELLEDTSTPQYQALEWMSYSDKSEPSVDDSNLVKKLIQRYALVVLYFATGGPDWENDLNFLSDTDECSWNRSIRGKVKGASDCKDGFVSVLSLKKNSLNGALPSELGVLASLTRVSFYDNNLKGGFPESLENLKSLDHAEFQKNEFEGSLDLLCGNHISTLLSDCGKKGGVECSCCFSCGFRQSLR